jgi:ubiquinone/menaquinone biosynthesis C-methylase UbiE
MKKELPSDEVGLWEAAYLRFETPRQEIRKFKQRLIKLGAERWPLEANVVELFCGRGNGLAALAELGFRHIEGIDLSPRLVAQYKGDGVCYVGDCRRLPFADSSKDLLIVQGGLHHLTNLPGDLDEVLAEVRRVLRQGGRFVAVEPWLTPFLRFVHAISRQAICRRISNKVDAFAAMFQYERQTYERWLGVPDMILPLFNKYFDPEHLSIAWGKLAYVGSPKQIPDSDYISELA